MVSPNQSVSRAPPIDRTIAVSPSNKLNRTESSGQVRSIMRTPERLSTVPEVESTAASGEGYSQAAMSPPVSRLSSRSRQRRTSSSASDKASKRRAMEQAEEMHRQSRESHRSHRSHGSGSSRGSQSGRHGTPQQEGYVTPTKQRGSSRGNG